MSLRVLEYSRSREFFILTSCPACGYEFEPDESRHIHIGEHDPEDFGLNPLGEIDENHQDPLFEDVDELGGLAYDDGSDYDPIDNREGDE